MRRMKMDLVDRCVWAVFIVILTVTLGIWGFISTKTQEANAFREVLSNLEPANIVEIFDKNSDNVCLKNITNLKSTVTLDESNRLTQTMLANMDKTNLSTADTQILLNVVTGYLNKVYGESIETGRLDTLGTQVHFVNTQGARAAYEETGFKYGKNIVGFYRPTTEDVFIDVPRNWMMTDVMATLLHESFHYVSDDGLNLKILEKGPVKSYKLHVNVTEGVTELYAIRGMASMGYCYSSSAYPRQVEIMSAFEEAVGAEVLKEAYLSGDANILRKHFNAAFESQDAPIRSAFTEMLRLDKYEAFNQALDAYANAKSFDILSTRNQVYALIEQYKQHSKNQ